MTFDEYQVAAGVTAVYPNRGENLMYPALGLCGESGEVAEVVKKMFRDDNGILTDERRTRLAGELGDVLWYIAALCHESGLNMADVARANIEKLARRRAEQKLHGSGSER